MVGVLIRMHLAMQRQSLSGMRLFWIGVGLLLAAGTLSLGVTKADDPTVAADLLASAFAGWTLALVAAPIFGRGSGIRPEHLALLPIPPRKLAVGLLGAAAVGFGPVIAFIAFAALGVYGFQFGVKPGVIGVVAGPLQWIMALLLARVVHSLMGQAMQTRLGMEVVALVFGLFIALTSVGWFVIQPVAGQTNQVLTDGWPSPIATLFRVLPSGWGIVAIDAARQSDWKMVVAMFLAFGAFIGGFLLVWAALLARSMSLQPTGQENDSHAIFNRVGLPFRLPATPVGAVIGRELRTWMRDPWRALELRIALWTGLFMGGIPLLIGFRNGLPFVGVAIVIMGGTVSANLFGLDGSALWQTLLTPGAERVEVRGRQWAWLVIFAPVSLVATVVLTALSGASWAWPLVLTLLAAALGGTAGLVALFSVFFPSPGLDPRLRKNPMDSSGDIWSEVFFMPWLAALTTAPAAAICIWGLLEDHLALQWAGLPIGIGTGILCAWGMGYLTFRRLEARGPELLNLLLKGSTPQEKPAAKRRPTADLPLKKKVIVWICASLFWLPLFPQGIVPLVFKLTSIDAKSWFLALYLPAPYQWPVILAMIAVGAGMLTLVFQIPRHHQRQQHDNTDMER